MTVSLTLVDDAQFILERELAAIVGRTVLLHPAMIAGYVDEESYKYAEDASRIIAKIAVKQCK